jgi:hypothetical protein
VPPPELVEIITFTLQGVVTQTFALADQVVKPERLRRAAAGYVRLSASTNRRPVIFRDKKRRGLVVPPALVCFSVAVG